MENEESLPLSRMATLNKPSFWIFILVCMGLYVANKLMIPDGLDSDITNPHDLLIIGVAFTGLLLNILIISLANKTITRVLTITSYIFEAASVVALLFLVFSK